MSFATVDDLSAAAGNLVEDVVINIEDIIGTTTIDNYFHYMVRFLFVFKLLYL